MCRVGAVSHDGGMLSLLGAANSPPSFSLHSSSLVPSHLTVRLHE